MRSFVSRLLLLCVITSIAPGAAFAQGSAQITGTVRDPMNAGLGGAEVTATQVETGFTRRTVTDKSGSWVLPNMPVGPYRLTVSHAGVRTIEQTDVVLQLDSEAFLN